MSTPSRRAPTFPHDAGRLAAPARDVSPLAMERLAKLQAVTAALAASSDLASVGAVVTDAVLDATGAAAGGLRVTARLPDGTDVMRIVERRGYPDTMTLAVDIVVDRTTPLGEGILTRDAVFLASNAEWGSRFPEASENHRRSGFEAAASLPCMHHAVAGAINLSFSGPHSFTDDERAFLRAIASQTAVALERARLTADAARHAERSDFLAEASQALSMPLDVDETLALITRLPVPELADYCMVYQLGRDGLVHRVARAHRDPNREALLDELEATHPIPADSDLPAARVLRTQQPVFAPHLTVEQFRANAPSAEYLAIVERLGLRSGITIPLVARGRSLGTLIFAAAEPSDRRFDEDDFRAALAFTERAALALDTTRLLAEARQARVEAEGASRAKSDFLAVMSHELRTPLNAIGGYAELMELELRGPVTTQQREDLSRIRRSQRHLLGLINQVLSYARVDRGGITYDMTDVPLDDAIRTAEAIVAPQLIARSIAYAYTPCQAAVTVRADAEKLRQTLLNLLANAAKFTPTGGRIEVACETSAERVAVHVRDTGLGIAADKLDAIFEPFFQVDRTLASTQEGVGLGLAISRELVRGMSGDLTVESALAAGSTFTITLPRA